jgi:hypothetical protein
VGDVVGDVIAVDEGPAVVDGEVVGGAVEVEKPEVLDGRMATL